MSMTETPPPVPAKAKKPAKKKTRKAPRQTVAPKTAKAEVAFPGLTESDCSTACTAARCAISGLNVCGHPRKGGIVGTDAGALQRQQQAQKQLGTTAVDKRFS